MLLSRQAGLQPQQLALHQELGAASQPSYRPRNLPELHLHSNQHHRDKNNRDAKNMIDTNSENKTETNKIEKEQNKLLEEFVQKLVADESNTTVQENKIKKDSTTDLLDCLYV